MKEAADGRSEEKHCSVWQVVASGANGRGGGQHVTPTVLERGRENHTTEHIRAVVLGGTGWNLRS